MGGWSAESTFWKVRPTPKKRKGLAGGIGPESGRGELEGSQLLRSSREKKRKLKGLKKNKTTTTPQKPPQK